MLNRRLWVVAGYPSSGKSFLLDKSKSERKPIWRFEEQFRNDYADQFDREIFNLYAESRQGRLGGVRQKEPWFNQNHMNCIIEEPLNRAKDIIIEIDLSVLYECDHYCFGDSKKSICTIPKGPMMALNAMCVAEYFSWCFEQPFWSNFEEVHLVTLLSSFKLCLKQNKSKWIRYGYNHSYAEVAYRTYLSSHNAALHHSIMEGWLISIWKKQIRSNEVLLRNEEGEDYRRIDASDIPKLRLKREFNSRNMPSIIFQDTAI